MRSVVTFASNMLGCALIGIGCNAILGIDEKEPAGASDCLAATGAGCVAECLCAYCPAEATLCNDDADCRAIVACYSTQPCSDTGCEACAAIVFNHREGAASALALNSCYALSCQPVCGSDASADAR